jgi:hypothetical protein
VMVEPRQAGGLDCPFQNAAVSVCRLASASTAPAATALLRSSP